VINQLLTPILDGGIRSTYFFNGRLLSAEDLRQEQNAQQRAYQQLGRALGDGVAYGLRVAENTVTGTKTEPVVTVTAGLGLNRAGQTIELTSDLDVALTRPSQPGGASVTALFADCPSLPTAGSAIAGQGVYLLTIKPAAGTEGRAPVSGLGNIDAACNAKYQVNGVQLRLIQLNVSTGPAGSPEWARLRNRVAHQCYGSSDTRIRDFLANPFGPNVAGYGLIDDLRSTCLTDDEVPLAVIYWTTEGIQFIDEWAARRRITHPIADTTWPLLVADRRIAEAEAMFLLFEAHIEYIRDKESGLATLPATDRFEYLPPVGLLPIIGQNSPNGFNWSTFFGSLAPERLDVTDASLLPYLIRESFQHQPIGVNDAALGQVTLYLIRENADAVQAGVTNQLALIFARPGVAYSGVSRFEYGGWDVSQF